LEKDAKYKPNLVKLLIYDIGYIDFKNILIYSDYFQYIKRNIFAMIQQLGHLTFFITFTSAISIYALTDFYKNRGNGKHSETLEDKDINYLIIKEPIICSRYYRHRINPLK
jgi:hypothetical protein